MVHANNNYISEAVNCPENEYEPLQHRNEEHQFLLNHFSMSEKRVAMTDVMQWKNRSFWKFHAYQQVLKLQSLHLYYDIKAIKIQIPSLPPPFNIMELHT